MVKKNRWQTGLPCVYCHVPMTPSVGGDVKPVATAVTKDHKITQQAFKKIKCEQVRNQKNDPENILLVCFRCNNIRGNTSYAVFYPFAQYVIRQYPYAPAPLLRIALLQYKEHLCDIAVSNKKETRRALSLALLSIAEQVR